MFENFIKKLQNPTEKFITLETTPTHAANFDVLMGKIEKTGVHTKIDGFSTTDNPLAQMKYSALFGTIKLQNKFQKPVLTTISMRDKNKIALQSDLLGANDFDVRAILALTGDGVKSSDQPNTKGVFEGDSTLLLDIISSFNNGIDIAKKPFLRNPQQIYPFTVINSYSKSNGNLLNKMIKKMEHGTIGIVTQPVFNIAQMENLIKIRDEARDKTGRNSELIFGFFPIVKFKTADFLSKHVPGIHVPEDWLNKLYDASLKSPEHETSIGMELSKNLFDNILNNHSKMHMMTANKFKLASKFFN
jgi:5,10-methylenetetrahydrofolate reductase